MQMLPVKYVTFADGKPLLGRRITYEDEMRQLTIHLLPLHLHFALPQNPHRCAA